MDWYLENTSYALQTWLSLRTAVHSVWRKQVNAVGAHETANRLKSFWVNIGLVSALLIGVSYSSAVTPVVADSGEDADEIAVKVSTTLTGISVILSLATIVICVIYMIEIDNNTTERDLRDFINANAPIVDLLTGVFSASVVTLLLSALTAMFVTYGQTEFIIVAAVTGTIVLLAIVFAAVVAGHNRFRLWVRYDSPEGRALVAARDRECGDGLAKLQEELMFQVEELREIKDYLELKETKDRILSAVGGSA
uniref:Transmembrane protein n=1 Tax=Chlamydomonas leiostraca TaxID=1034604 RepID=A0A7S0RWL3_9CHLO